MSLCVLFIEIRARSPLALMPPFPDPGSDNNDNDDDDDGDGDDRRLHSNIAALLMRQDAPRRALIAMTRIRADLCEQRVIDPSISESMTQFHESQSRPINFTKRILNRLIAQKRERKEKSMWNARHL